MNCDEFSSIPDWIIEHPESAAVFNRFGLDTSCGGKSLQYVCCQNELAVNDVLSQLLAAIAQEAVVNNQTDGESGKEPVGDTDEGNV